MLGYSKDDPRGLEASIKSEGDAQHIDFSTVEISETELRSALFTSREFWIEYFLGDEIVDCVPAFHIYVANRMFVPDADKPFVAALPRGHSKTTIAKLACLFQIFMGSARFIVYTSSTTGIAANALSDVWDMVNSQAAMQAFGIPFEIRAERVSEGFYRFKVNAFKLNPMTGCLEQYEKSVIMRAQGANMQVRGLNVENRRPDFAIVDDLESEENVKTSAGYRKLKAWFYSTFRKALAKDGQLIVIGNLIAAQTLLNDLLRSPRWHSMRLGALLSDGEPLWPWRWSKEAIVNDMLEYLEEGQLSSWMGEMMNMPINIESGLVNPDKINYTDVRASALYRDGKQTPDRFSFITVDPAASTEEWADEAAIVVHTVEYGVHQISAYIHEHGMGEEGMIQNIIKLSKEWGVKWVGVESIAMQRVLKSYFSLYCKIRAIDLHFVDILGSRASKLVRLRAFAARLTDTSSSLAQGDIDVTAQLVGFDTAKTNNKDDLIDACSMGNEMLHRYKPALLCHSVAANTKRQSLPQTTETTSF